MNSLPACSRDARVVVAALFLLLVLTAGSRARGGDAGEAPAGGVPAGESEVFLRGDANQDGRHTLADVFRILYHLHLSVPIPCRDAADVDDSGSLNLVDPIRLMLTLFFRRLPPPPPFHTPGADPTADDSLDCEQSLPQFEGRKGGQGAVDCEHRDGVADLDFIHFARNVYVYPGQTGVRVPVLFNSIGGVEGFTLSFYAEPEQIELRAIDVSNTIFGTLVEEPQLVHVHERSRKEGYLSVTAGMRLFPPFRTLPQLYEAAIANLHFDVNPGVAPGEELFVQFRDVPGSEGLPPIRNDVSREGASESHTVCALRIRVVSTDDEVFIRGDGNRDWQVDLGDVIAVLQSAAGAQYETLPSPPACPDAADVNDDGRVGIDDAITLLDYLFAGGPPPAYPYPEIGADATGDSLGCGLPTHGKGRRTERTQALR